MLSTSIIRSSAIIQHTHSNVLLKARWQVSKCQKRINEGQQCAKPADMHAAFVLISTWKEIPQAIPFWNSRRQPSSVVWRSVVQWVWGSPKYIPSSYILGVSLWGLLWAGHAPQQRKPSPKLVHFPATKLACGCHNGMKQRSFQASVNEMQSASLRHRLQKSWPSFQKQRISPYVSSTTLQFST